VGTSHTRERHAPAIEAWFGNRFLTGAALTEKEPRPIRAATVREPDQSRDRERVSE